MRKSKGPFFLLFGRFRRAAVVVVAVAVIHIVLIIENDKRQTDGRALD
jgi:hypothetical protein